MLLNRDFCHRHCALYRGGFLLLLAGAAITLPLRPSVAQGGADDDEKYVVPSPATIPVYVPKASPHGFLYDTGTTELDVIHLPGDHGRPTNTEDRPVKTMSLSPWHGPKTDPDGNSEYELYRSPSGRYALLQWKIVRGVNGMILFRRGASGEYRRAEQGKGKTFTQRAADNAGTTGSDYARKTYAKDDDGWFLIPIRWHGAEDRYLDLELNEDHGPLIWRGTYDAVQDRFIEDKPHDFGPHSPRAHGELFPETRTRLLTDTDVSQMSYAKVRYAINEIYARHGFVFDGSNAIQKHFESLDWYRADDGLMEQSKVDPLLTDNERANLKVLGRRRDYLVQHHLQGQK
jgi:hypothetical protein